MFGSCEADPIAVDDARSVAVGELNRQHKMYLRDGVDLPPRRRWKMVHPLS